ncbi:hypothetical protein DFH09DRAFT_1085647 [Mycena vulgaris]|nr:hypothetical protein DFH09DRAFT_1085647 [Mycena vulgaris]
MTAGLAITAGIAIPASPGDCAQQKPTIQYGLRCLCKTSKAENRELGELNIFVSEDEVGEERRELILEEFNSTRRDALRHAFDLVPDGPLNCGDLSMPRGEIIENLWQVAGKDAFSYFALPPILGNVFVTFVWFWTTTNLRKRQPPSCSQPPSSTLSIGLPSLSEWALLIPTSTAHDPILLAPSFAPTASPPTHQCLLRVTGLRAHSVDGSLASSPHGTLPNTTPWHLTMSDYDPGDDWAQCPESPKWLLVPALPIWESAGERRGCGLPPWLSIWTAGAHDTIFYLRLCSATSTLPIGTI